MVLGYRLHQAKLLLADGQERAHQTVVTQNETIQWVGNDKDCPVEYMTEDYISESCSGQIITPGLIDCHTHLIYAGDRSPEFRMRQNGISYAEIAKQGGGILSTVHATREASEKQLFDLALPRLRALISEGVTAVEIKSGYGLDFANERKMLRVASLLAEETSIHIDKTFLGAHAVPSEFKGDAQRYIDYLCHDVIPDLVTEGLCDSVDVFCEHIAFNLAQTEQIFQCAKAHQLNIKCHAGQLSDMGAVELAAQYHALSCDHVEYVSESGIKQMAEHDMVAVLLPGAFYTLKETQKPPVEQMRRAGVSMAVATDANPGTSPTASLRLMMNMACHFFGLTVAEALAGTTTNAAKALGLSDKMGCIRVGYQADLIRWSLDDSAALCYYFASPIAHQTMIAGQWQPEFPMRS